MNCANHPQNPVTAYCRTCGKPLCSSCTRQMMGVIYCDNCLAERVSESVPPPSALPYQAAYRGPVQPLTGPNPALAGILAGFFPFGVGALYCEQHAKFLAYLIVFVLLIEGASHSTSDVTGTSFGLGIAAFYLYQLIDAIKSAKTLQSSQSAPDPAVAAYCRSCGKPLCSSCTRQVMGVIYCENCVHERMSGSMPPPLALPYQTAYRVPVQPVTGPNPILAGILAGLLPFGVGAVYCGQYAKFLAHLIVFALLIVGAGHFTSDAMGTIFGLGIAAFYFYQLLDAIKSAKAIRVGQPAPDPFGLGSMFIKPNNNQNATVCFSCGKDFSPATASPLPLT